ncbi:protocadherin gamma-A1 isoform X2 [Physeter macrocephalus]|uniref:Protocadherin gamma-A1 isoform X2 n=1 Tax=Physeter macrocephalus TaxID=9755 RepID=A0A455BJH3_PHYMC|nr:protocadherin gamma-A1 isoform X2 [Physeter catodon]|eukprot:XP_028349120.1 protocadherin gamma-A1 isoform X2 [Physeter catodon]
MTIRVKVLGCRRLVLLFLFLGLLLEAQAGKIRYSVPEETDKDFFVGNIAKDLGLQPQELAERGVRIVSRGRTQLFALNPRSSSLVTAGRIDREELCAQSLQCLVSFNVLVEDKMKLFPVEVEIMDINDNTPQFQLEEVEFKMNEITTPGTRITLPSGQDLDVGMNSLQMYQLSSNPHFSLDVQQGSDGSQQPEMVLQSPLDREEDAVHRLLLTAFDGGNPVRSGTLRIRVQVVDANDNPPAFTQAQYHTSVPENVPLGTRLLTVKATDPDEGANGEVTYLFHNIDHKVAQIFHLDSYTGEISNKKPLDFEEYTVYPMEIQAQDGSSLVARAKDSYSTYIPENNPRGAAIFSVTAHDADSNENARVTYSLVEDTIHGVPLSSFVSINSDTGVLYALRSFDYEQFRDLQLRVMARDSGDPPLSSNVSLAIFVLDQNDNTPEILYPALPTEGSTGVELAPPSAEPGYLVTKVVAVDRDSGQNAWLSYRLLKASEPALFSVGLHTGEVRTARAVMDRDALKQSLVVAVEDHGQPPLSATVTLTVAMADSIPDVLADLGSMEPSANLDNSSLTLYLVVAVAAVSCVFLAFVIVLLALRLRHWHRTRLLQASGGGLAGVPVSHFVGVDGVRAFLQTYSHEVSLTADSRGSHVTFPPPNYADTLISQESHEKKDFLSAPQFLLEDRKQTFSQMSSVGMLFHLGTFEKVKIV